MQLWLQVKRILALNHAPFLDRLHTYLCLYSNAGIAPDWDDPQIQNGGLWLAHTSDVVSRDPDVHGGYTLHDAWMDTVMHAIGEQFPDSFHVAGVALNIRKNGSRLSLWTRGAKNEAAEKVRLELVPMPCGNGICFEACIHLLALQDRCRPSMQRAVHSLFAIS
jgi:hypothetical protein